ncbi:MAG TPA: S53 family peptidase [Methanomicrobiales archaeon]|nr:S53 family peptidase [Methanomicrobiales archaeon]
MNVPKSYKRVEGSERTTPPEARAVGPADPEELITVSIRLRRRLDAPLMPDAATVASSQFGDQVYVSREQFTQQFGASPEDIRLVEDFARSHDLVVVESSAARRTVVVSGTVGRLSAAFVVKLSRVKSAEGTFRVREGYVHVPEELAKVVEAVAGLDNRPMAKRRISALAKPHTAAPRGIKPLTPLEVAGCYNFPTSQTYATGQTIGIIELGGGYKTSDIQAYFAGLGLPTPTITNVSVDGGTNSPGASADTEVVLDICVAAAVARGAKIAVYFAPNTNQGFIDVITTAIHDTTNNISVLSISWGNAESAWPQSTINTLHSSFQTDAPNLGVTVFAASGDWGSSDGFAGGKARADYPASDPYVTGCGGTQIKDCPGSGMSEATWADAGGGISDRFPLPVWQQGIGVPASANDGHIGRGVPDVAGNADAASGYPLIINGKNYIVWGTSAVAPLYAGLIALINAIKGVKVGYLNPRLYDCAKKPGQTVTRDIADGVSNASNNAPGYTAGTGWDAVTGWGSINGTALMNCLYPLWTPCVPAKICLPQKICMPIQRPPCLPDGCQPLCIPYSVCPPVLYGPIWCTPSSGPCGPWVEKIPDPGEIVTLPVLEEQIEKIKSEISALRAKIEEKKKTAGRNTK